MRLEAGYHGRASASARPWSGAGWGSAADDLSADLSELIAVHHHPLGDAVARLDGSTAGWVLHLDSESPPEDRYWAMLDVLRVLLGGAEAAVSATRTSRLRLVPGQGERRPTGG